MIDANDKLEQIFENAMKEAEKRRHEYVTIVHILLALVKEQDVGTVLHDMSVKVLLITEIETYRMEVQ